MKILLLRNRIKFQFEDDRTKYKSWLMGLGLDSEITVKEVDLPLKYSLFIDRSYWLCSSCSNRNGFGNTVCEKCKKLRTTEGIIKDTLWGLNGIKEQIREEALVPPCQYQLVVFCYDVYESGWKDEVGKGLCFWTYPNDLNGAAFIEMGLKDWYDSQDAMFNALRHESIHSFNRMLNWRGIYFTDTLDQGKDISMENSLLAVYKPFFKKMVEFSLSFRIVKIKELIQYYQVLLKDKLKRDIENMIRRICRTEGVPQDWENIIVAVIKAESGLNTMAICDNKDGTKDLGLCQFNTYWYIEKGKAITAQEAFNDPEKSVRVMIEYFYRRKRMNDWIAYKMGAYLKYM